jgi:hypothetical protein
MEGALVPMYTKSLLAKDEYFKCTQQGINKAKPIFLDGMA